MKKTRTGSHGPKRKSRAHAGKGPQTIGMIGLGIMGSAMAANLIRDGYSVIGYDVAAARRLRAVSGIMLRNDVVPHICELVDR